MKKPNAYLQKQEDQKNFILNAGMDTGFQKCWDLMQICLRDPEFMGADVCQRNLDAKLGEVWGDELCPFKERYPYVRDIDYSKGRKEWK